MAQVQRTPKSYDVCIVGSGAGGGMAAKILTEGGLCVALLEAGPNVDPEKDFKMLAWPYDLPHRGAGVGGRASENFGEFLAPNGAWDIEGEPYTSAPGNSFQWFRSRIVGGRTHHGGRIALRFAPIDFTSNPRAPDGLFPPPPNPRCTEILVKKACDKLNTICIPSRMAILTKSVHGRLP